MPKTAGPRVPRLPDVTTDLRKLLNITQGKASGWLKQRAAIAGELATIRDAAERLLGELAGTSKGSRRFQEAAEDRRPGRKPGFKMSPAARRKISESARRRWAARKSAKKGS